MSALKQWRCELPSSATASPMRAERLGVVSTLGPRLGARSVIDSPLAVAESLDCSSIDSEHLEHLPVPEDASASPSSSNHHAMRTGPRAHDSSASLGVDHEEQGCSRPLKRNRSPSCTNDRATDVAMQHAIAEENAQLRAQLSSLAEESVQLKAKAALEAEQVQVIRQVVAGAVAKASEEIEEMKLGFEIKSQRQEEEISQLKMQLQQSQLDLSLARRNLDRAKDEALRMHLQHQQQHQQQQRAGAASASKQQEWPGCSSGGAAAGPGSQHGQKGQQQQQQQQQQQSPNQKYGGLSKEEWWSQARQQQQQEWKQGGSGAGAYSSRPTRCEYEDPSSRGCGAAGSNSNGAGASRSRFPCPGNSAPELGASSSEQALRTFLLQAGMDEKDMIGMNHAQMLETCKRKLCAWECRRLLACAALTGGHVRSAAAFHHQRTFAAVQQQYKELSRKVHPDKNHGDPCSTPAFQFLKAALDEMRLLMD